MKAEAKAEKQNWIDPIEKDDLIGIATIINSLIYISGDILEDYFYKLDPRRDKDNILFLPGQHERYRAYMDVVFSGIHEVGKILTENGITV